jgi:hypothetical protein
MDGLIARLERKLGLGAVKSTTAAAAARRKRCVSEAGRNRIALATKRR